MLEIQRKKESIWNKIEQLRNKMDRSVREIHSKGLAKCNNEPRAEREKDEMIVWILA